MNKHDLGTTDPRQLRTLTAGVDLDFQPIEVSETARTYVRETARSLQMTGVFVHTENPPAPGTVLSLELRLIGQPPRRALGLVRWRSLLEHCPGMALDVAAADVTESRSIATWLANSLTAETMLEDAPLSRLGAWIGRTLAHPFRPAVEHAR